MPQGSRSVRQNLPSQRQGAVPGQVLVTLGSAVSVTGHPLPRTRVAARAPLTSDAALNAKLQAVGATSLQPLLPGLPKPATEALTQTARAQLGSSASDLSRTFVLHVDGKDSAAVARSLRGAPGVVYAEPNRYVNTMNTGGRPLPATALRSAAHSSPTAGRVAPTSAASVPSNYALSSSAQPFLNAGGVNAVGAFAELHDRYGQQPGAGERITNVSIGDLTDQSMADAGDDYVGLYGPTTMMQDGRRYLDLPSMPLIPTYVAQPDGKLSDSASTEHQDPALDEVLLDFSVMSPLAHDQQRTERIGSGYTDLLGIAPGADYRLVVPQEPTVDQITGALVAAAQQSPRPDVITASLGFGTDSVGFPGRYLEDDPVVRSVVTDIVHRYGIVVSISSNDGTRLFTPTAVGPDGGSTPTDLAKNAADATSINDDAASTTPSKVPDSGAIAAGGTTLDDTLAAPADQNPSGTTAETRISGFGTFSSGFGSRVDLSAPSDNIAAFAHPKGGDAQAVTVALNGGTSASAPEIAAAAAVVLQAGRLSGHPLSPEQVRALLEGTGREVPSPAQIDRTLHVGPQIDITAAVERVLGGTGVHPAIARLSAAHRVVPAGWPDGLFTETTDQNRIDLGDVALGGDGGGLMGPVTFAGDITGLPRGAQQRARYTLTVGSTVFESSTPAIRVTPRRLLDAAGLPVLSTSDRDIQVIYRVLVGGRVAATAQRTITIGSSNGEHTEAAAPRVPSVVQAGRDVTVRYDLSGVTGTDAPQLVLSTVGHWSPSMAPLFTAAWHQPLTDSAGTVTIPASAFRGGGIYGIGIAQAGFGGNPRAVHYSQFAPVRVQGGTAAVRPEAPLLAGSGSAAGHAAEVTRAAPGFSLRYDVRAVPGAVAAEAEFSAPAPTVNKGALNTFSNSNGSAFDDDGTDTPSVLHTTLPAASGTAHLNARALGLPTSLNYNVRVLALDGRHHVIGQASPTSMLSVDDGPAPDGSWVLSFAAAGADSLVALQRPDGGTEVRHYSTASATYGRVLTSDPVVNSDYEVIGQIPAAHRALLVRRDTQGGDAQVETWDTRTDTLVGSYTVAVQDALFVTAAVDPARHRAALLLRGASDKSDIVRSVDLTTGTVGAPIDADTADVAKGTYTKIAIDGSTGEVYLAKSGGIVCLGGVLVARVNLDSGSVTNPGSVSGCSAGFASDDAGTLYTLSAVQGSTKIVPTSFLTGMDATTGDEVSQYAVRREPPSAMAIDNRNRVAVLAFAQPEGTPYFGSQYGYVPDNNAMGQLVVMDLKTGQVLRTLSTINVRPYGGNLIGDRGAPIQLDPASRTGWIIGPYNAQVQQFSY
ncbi:S8 family serine peptidase [Streptomyces sp. NPDC001070]